MLSSSVSVEDSPVVPLTTMPSWPVVDEVVDERVGALVEVDLAVRRIGVTIAVRTRPKGERSVMRTARVAPCGGTAGVRRGIRGTVPRGRCPDVVGAGYGSVRAPVPRPPRPRHDAPASTSPTAPAPAPAACSATRCASTSPRASRSLTTKKLHLRSIIGELLWFLRGDTNVRWLQERGISIWDEWADEHGDLGPVYGHQWRSWPTPDGRAGRPDRQGHRVDPHQPRLAAGTSSSAWNVADVDDMALPPCHTMFQFYVRPRTAGALLDCQLYQRSADIFLGVPFNIASYALLTMMVAQVCDLRAGRLRAHPRRRAPLLQPRRAGARCS